jgi:hypothetical protein
LATEKGPARRACIEGFSDPIRHGVHRGIRKFHGVESEEELSATLAMSSPAVAG